MSFFTDIDSVDAGLFQNKQETLREFEEKVKKSKAALSRYADFINLLGNI